MTWLVALARARLQRFVNASRQPALACRRGGSSLKGRLVPRLAAATPVETGLVWLQRLQEPEALLGQRRREVDGGRAAGHARPSSATSADRRSVDACTLPTEAQPLRVAEFGDVFAASLRGVLRVSSTRLRLELDAAAEDTVRDLTARETDCCGFFSFSLTSAESDTVWLDVQVPASRVEVLNGLAAQAQAARAA